MAAKQRSRGHQRAIGRVETLVRTVKLKRLSVVAATLRFPESGELTVGEHEQERDWRSGVVIKNADGAKFGYVCVYRKSADGKGDDLLCALQGSWGFRFQPASSPARAERMWIPAEIHC
ncbi:hypothetical protein BGX28_006901 [Mortierella sp. GBA30]|nr:hypothetical protein BGX28_006901 [Mortierella sp. GBA30]